MGRFKTLCVMLLAACISLVSTAPAISKDTQTSQPSIRIGEENEAPLVVWDRNSIRSTIDKSLEESENLIGKKDLKGAAQCLRSAGRLQGILGDRDSALRTLNKAQDLSKNLSPIEAITTLTLYSRLLVENGESKKAGTFVDQAISLAERTTDPTATGLAVRSRGELKEANRDFAGAEVDFEAAVGIFRQTNSDLRLARTLLILAGARVALGKLREGRENTIEARSLFEKFGDARGIVISRLLEGHFLNLLGQKQEAQDAYLAAEAGFSADTDPIEKARLKNGLAYLYQGLGEINLAYLKTKEALELFKDQKYWTAVSITLPALVDLSFRLGDENAAWDYLKQSEDLSRRMNDDLGPAASYGFVGDYYFRVGNDEKAVSYYKRALPLLEKKSQLFAASGINGKLGSIFARQGKLTLAKSRFDRSLAVSRQIHNEVGESHALFNLSKLALQEGRTAEALKLSQTSIELTEKLSGSVRNSRLRGSHFASVFERYEMYIHTLMKAARERNDDTLVVHALQAAERSRARLITEHLALSKTQIIADAPPALIEKERDLLQLLQAASDKLANLLDAGASKQTIDAADSRIGELEHEIEELRSEIKRNSPIYSTIKGPAPFNAEAFRREVLDDHSVLLEFSLGESESYLWVVDKQKVSGRVLPPRKEIESLVAQARQALEQRQSKPEDSVESYQERLSEADEQYKISLLKLSEVLLASVVKDIEGKRLIVVADGALHHFPFSALLLPGKENGSPLVVTNQVVYQPSAQMLTVQSQLAKHREGEASKNLVVFSDPVFSREDERLSGKRPQNEQTTADNFRFVESLGSLSRLNGSGREARAVVKALDNSVDSFDGFSATRENFLRTNLSDYKIIHLATHALVDGKRPELSGIVFSRYDRESRQLDADLLRLQDIYALRLNSDLVVLSACETAVGKELRGEGLLSLNNAFLQAGSRSVMSTLWKVEDEASQKLMAAFYQGLAEGLSSSEALKQAQLSLMNEPRFQSPFYWAAFTLHGDFNARPEIVRPKWTYMSAGTAGALILLVAGSVILLRKRRRQTQ